MSRGTERVYALDKWARVFLRVSFMAESTPVDPAEPGLQVRTYFVRGRNALVARANLSELYVDYYLHLGAHGVKPAEAHDALFKRALAAYTAMGFGVAIDDVGTRHSNLETVMSLRPHFIKISDVLVRGIARSTVKREMLRSLRHIAETIDAVMVAEGIEHVEDVVALRDLGLRYGQGYYMARPAPPFVTLKDEVRAELRSVSPTSSPEPIEAPPDDGPVVTSFVFNVRNLPAALYKALGGFATNGVNMTKLESYMVDGEFTATQFLAEVDGHPEHLPVKRALEELAFFTTDVKILGVYPADADARA